MVKASTVEVPVKVRFEFDESNIISIGKVNLGPGDVLVLRADSPLSEEQAERIARRVKDALARGVLVLDDGLKLAVVNQGQQAEVECG